MRTRPCILATALAIIALFSAGAAHADDQRSAAGGTRVGGPCRYASHAGRCTVVDVQKTSASISQKTVEGGPRYEGFRITFRFDGAAPGDSRLVAQALGREHELRLANSWYPGPRFVTKYGIAPSKSFACTLRTIEAGACTPIVFDIPAINRTDYFESAR